MTREEDPVSNAAVFRLTYAWINLFFLQNLKSFAVSPAVEKSSEQFSELPLADAPKKAISAISVSQNAPFQLAKRQQTHHAPTVSLGGAI
jgi:hypothetical protein